MRLISPAVLILHSLVFTYTVFSAPGVPPSECRSLMDIVFVLDGSDSITAVDYQKQREALSSLIRELHLGPDLARVGLVVYSTTVAQTVPLTFDEGLLIKETTNLIHPRDGTKTALGIATMRELFASGGRAGVPWVCIVITDGISKDPPKTKQESLMAKEMGINMFAVGISHFIQQEELEAIASSPNQVLMLKSFDQLHQSLSGLMKVVCPCPPLPPIANAILDNGPRSIGSVRSYACEAGFQPIGNPTVECLADSNWSPLQFACLACPPPPVEFGNGLITDGPLLLDTVREYICKPGFSSPEPLLTTCVTGPDGPIWTEPKLSCLACAAPPVPKHAYLEPPIKSALVDTIVSFQCMPGFIPSGPIESTCITEMGLPGWTTPVHGCIACDMPPEVMNAMVDSTGGTLVNDVRAYTCLPGYHATGPIEAICMGDKGATFWKLSPHKCIPCIEPPMLANAVLNVPGDTLVGTVRTYECLPGFQPTGPLETMCVGANGVTSWDGPHNGCIACEAPPVIPNAILDPKGDFLIGSVRRYTCMQGYVASGPIEISCMGGKTGPMWSAPEFQCITCDMPPPLPNAVLDLSGDNFVGHQRYYNCLDGFTPTLPGPIMIECVAEVVDNRGRAVWSPPSHACTACPAPPPIEHALVGPGDTLVGSTRRYDCVKGMYATGPITITCLPDATWSIPEHSCTACGPTPDVPNAIALPGGHTLGTIRQYECAPGFVPDAPAQIECLVNAQWSPVSFACVACQDPYPIEHGVLEPGNNLVGTVRMYTCLPGYLATGPITSTCAFPKASVLPDWSAPVHYCKDCGEPYVVQNANIIPGPRTIGSVQSYVCVDGYVPSSPANSHCMQNGEWSIPEFTCIACGKPPVMEHATIDEVGGQLVGSVRAYTCILGYVATGPIEATCVAKEDGTGTVTPYWQMLSDNACRDCGVPPTIQNSYCSLGPSTVGTVRQYACDDGYDMAGNGAIECLSTGQWSLPDFTCSVRTTTTTTTPAPVKNDPSVCDGCRMLNGVGYINHPYDCTQYVQCFYSAKGGIEAVYMPCPFGQYWDQGDLTCKPADMVNCPHERCKDPNLTTYKHSDSTKCCAYWECENGRSVAKCCGDFYRYVPGQGCQPDSECLADCPTDDWFPSCDKRPVLDITQYEQHIGNGYWIRMPCAPGTAFNLLDCECTLYTGIVPGYVCRPELKIDFNRGNCEDSSGKNVHINNEGVVPYEGAGYFNGSARLLVNRFSNTAFHGDLVIKLRYKEQLKGPTANSLQALVTNGDCGDDPSIIIAKMPGYVLCGAKTDKPKSFALPTLEKEWKEVIYVHDEKKLEGKVCGASYNKWSYGPIKSTHCGIQIGYGTGLASFMGLMDDIEVFQCRPPENLLSVYGGRRRVPIASSVH